LALATLELEDEEHWFRLHLRLQRRLQRRLYQH
jgi:hypothetical protein